MSDPAWRTQEPADFIWFEHTNYAAVVVGTVAYGIHICVFSLTALSLWKEKRPRWMIWLGLISVLFVCGSINIIMNNNFSQRAWIDYRNYPGGPLMYLLQEQSQPINTAGNAAALVVTFLSNAILIYRVHAVWRLWYILILPMLLFIAAFVLGIFFVIAASSPNSSIWADITKEVSLPFWASSMSLNMLLTALLVSRLLWMRREVTMALGKNHGRMYMGIATMIIESALPYGLIAFVFVILYGTGNTAANLFIPLLEQVECITPMLIILRVSRGHALNSDSVTKVRSGPSSGKNSGGSKVKTLPGMAFAGRPTRTNATFDSDATPLDDTMSGGRHGETSFYENYGLKTRDFPVGTEFHVTQLDTPVTPIEDRV